MKKLLTAAMLATGLYLGDAQATGGTCSVSGYDCLLDYDCPGNEICVVIGGGSTPCRDTSECYDGFYCKFTSGSTGVCTPYPDCSNGCTNCDTTAWTEHAPGYLTRVVATCDTTFCTCSKKTEYRCAPGYYGVPPSGGSGCSLCPSADGAAGISDAGSTDITNCRIPSGTAFSYSTGSGTYTDDCYYTK